jgi:hypothetical protein
MTFVQTKKIFQSNQVYLNQQGLYRKMKTIKKKKINILFQIIITTNMKTIITEITIIITGTSKLVRQ